MDNPTPPQATPSTSSGSSTGINWGVVLGAAIAATLVAGGTYYLLTRGTYPVAPQQTGAAQGDNSVESIESDLNASGSADSSADLNSLNQSL